MKDHLKVTALILALLTVISLFAGCNKNKEDDTGMPAFIFKPEYNEVKIDSEDFWIRGFVASSDAIYLWANVAEGEREFKYYDYDANGNAIEQSYMGSTYVCRLFRADKDGKNLEMLPNFGINTDYINEDAEERGVSMSNFFVTDDGKPGMIRFEDVTIYDLPEGFDPKNDQKWNYDSTNTTTYYYEVFDETGKTVVSKEVGKLVNGEGDGISSFATDGDGNIYTCSWNNSSSIFVYNPDMSQKIATIKSEGNPSSLIRMSNGKVAMSSWGDNGYELRTIDLAAGKTGDKLPLSQNIYNAMTGNGDYILYNRTEIGIVGVKADGTVEEVANWIDSDLNADNMGYIASFENGDFVCTSDSYDENGKHTIELIKLVKTPYDPNTKREVITVACMGIDYNTKQRVIAFNKKNTEYRMRLVDYSQYNTGDDNTAGITKLNTEIIAGHIPDIFAINTQMPITQYSGKGVLEDLTPYMERDFGKDAFVEDFYKTLRDDKGRLYEAYSSFYIKTAVGLEKVVGDGSSWTFADMKNAMGKLRDGASVLFNRYSRERAVREFVYNGMGSFVDWESGKCSFDSPEFIDILNFVKTFKTSDEMQSSGAYDEKYVEEYTRINNGDQLLMEETFYNFNDFRGETYYRFNDTPSFVGYPGTGSRFFSGWSGGYALSSKSKYKDVAWDFIKEILTEEYQTENRWDGLPTNKAVFEALITEAKTPAYIDPAESGDPAEGDKPVEESVARENVNTSNAAEDMEPAEAVDEGVRYSEYNKGSVNEKGWKEDPKTYTWMSDPDSNEGGWNVPVFAMTDAEEQTLRNLMKNITAFERRDTSLQSIVDEEMQAFFNGQKTAEEAAKMIQSRATIYVNEQK